jgi:hypothetical protein
MGRAVTRILGNGRCLRRRHVVVIALANPTYRSGLIGD